LKKNVNGWYKACSEAAEIIYKQIPEVYRSRTFSGVIGDIKALSPKKALSLISRKKGLGAQYSWLYLTQGIDNGRGYQACASEALDFTLGKKKDEILRGKVLDVGCAVGVTAGILSLPKVTCFDLFPDLLHTAKLIDSITGERNDYTAADMTRSWPYASVFNAVVCGLVCHHLKGQPDIFSFFSNANRVLLPGGFLVVTLPAGSISYAGQLENLIHELEAFGFCPEDNLSGIVFSTDNSHSLFWMYIIVLKKSGPISDGVSVLPEIDFAEFRTPVSREEKGVQARSTVSKNRQVRHRSFRFFDLLELKNTCKDNVLVFETIRKISSGLR
jgi:SAM-dependent methyltransferase